MSVYNRKLFFNRGGQVNARGTGITSGLVQPVQKFQEGGTVDPMNQYRQAVYAGLMSNRSRNDGPIGSFIDVLGQSLGAANPLLPTQQTEKDDDTYWAYNTATETYDRVTDETFKPGIHTKDAPKQDDVAEMSKEKQLWLETDPTPKTPPSAQDLTTMGTFPEFLKKIDKIKSDAPPNYKEETLNVFTLDKDDEFTVPDQITKFTEGNNVSFKDNNNKVITSDQFIFRGEEEAEDNMWVYNKSLGHSDYINTSDYDSSIHRKEEPEKLKGFEYTSIDDIDGKKYAIFTNPRLEGDAAVKKVEIGDADPATVKQGSVLDNTFQGLDGFEYEKYVDEDDGLVKARKIPGQIKPEDSTKQEYKDKTSNKGVVTIDNKDINATFTQTPNGYTITDPLPDSDTFGQEVLLTDFLEKNSASGFNIETNVPKELTATEVRDAELAKFDVESEKNFVNSVFKGVIARGGAEANISRRIEETDLLLGMIDLSTSGSYADQRNAMLRFLETFGLEELDLDLYNQFKGAIKGGNLPATEVVAALSQSGILQRAMAWSQQLNNTEVNILKNAGNQLFLTKEGQILLATINKRDAEIKNEVYQMYIDGMKNKENKFDLAVKLENERIRLYNEFGNSDEMKEAVATVTGITGIQDRDFFAKQGSIAIDNQDINLLKAYNNEKQKVNDQMVSTSLVFGGYADQKTREFQSPDGTVQIITRPELPVYLIKVGNEFHLKQFDLDGSDE
tara:strand:+ start:1041 stop:3233 length:2193 start_codon:yes stop_codon:yes gene_type:complete